MEVLKLPSAAWAILLASYLLLVRALRYRNKKYMTSLIQPHASNPSGMTYREAHPIVKSLLLYEYPFMVSFSTQWALIKSYAVPSGTQLLVDTRQLSTPKNVGKRAEDTGLILVEILLSGVDSERGSRALAKMNWLHRRYGKKILNRDMISTLCLFILEPIYWTEKYEWRAMTDLEQTAFFVYWKEIGHRMGIEGIPETLSELEAWNDDFLEHHVYYSDSNKTVADATLELFSRDLPRFLRPVLSNIASALLDERTRDALGWKRPNQIYSLAVDLFFRARALALKYFFLPRFYPAFTLPEVASDGRFYRTEYKFEPWYVKESFWTRIQRTLGLSSAPLPGPEFLSNGYLQEELGPIGYEKMSRADVLSEAEQLREYGQEGGMRGVGCPFRFTAKAA
ncbi:hypothetical protein BS50DRAFT_571249 [Corynespora cassiicola Philippines]|uniref:ER-bound oxygenase mpaB/mpaB'/Rubber oxygenase catalytic domain-containing protein n=1 Tax=Corynespora cassiicola Philippines TaxID=1448308 RepID=A0A2T2NXC5_CORCC|nr:hypothetical protein BS50DRAFT_571249 [Corynespora cassiicola Philippines]